MKHSILFVFYYFSLNYGNCQHQEFIKDSLIKIPFITLDSLSFSAGAISEYPDLKHYLFSDSALIQGPGLKIRADEMEVYYFQEVHNSPQKLLLEAHIYRIAYFYLDSKKIDLPIGYSKCILNLSNFSYTFLFN